MANYAIAQLDQLDPVQSTCGVARRAFSESNSEIATVHLTEIHNTAATHYHKTLTEIYTVLEGEGHLELDGDIIPVHPLLTVIIRPGCRHRAVGVMKLLIVVTPPFDRNDEWFD